jgi:hypothetical protein
MMSENFIFYYDRMSFLLHYLSTFLYLKLHSAHCLQFASHLTARPALFFPLHVSVFFSDLLYLSAAELFMRTENCHREIMVYLITII